MAENETRDLQSLLEGYNAQLQAEFGIAAMSTDKNDPVKMAEQVRLHLLKGCGVAIAQIVGLATNAESENVKLSACKFIIERTVGNAPIGESDDQLNMLIKRLQSGDKNAIPTAPSPHED